MAGRRKSKKESRNGKDASKGGINGVTITKGGARTEGDDANSSGTSNVNSVRNWNDNNDAKSSD